MADMAQKHARPLGINRLKEGKKRMTAIKVNGWSASCAVFFGALCAYLGTLLIPLMLLVAVMVVDYLTGMAKAYTTGTISSRIGIKGILKKVGYLVIVAVGMVVDWLVQDALVTGFGIDLKVQFLVALLVIVWLIINECVSILENVAAMGAPVPGFIVKIVNRLKNTVEDKAGSAGAEPAESEDNDA